MNVRMQSVLRLLQLATYPFLALSLLILCGALGFGSAFIADFTIENQSTHPITVIPIGTVGADGRRFPLPLTVNSYINLPAFAGRSFHLLPGGNVAISYDMDDINFSEIVVQDERAQFFQLVIDPNPLINQYHGPSQTQYVIKDLGQLQAPPAVVKNAAMLGLRGNSGIVILYGLLIGPWLAYAGTAVALRKPPKCLAGATDGFVKSNKVTVERRA